MGYGKEDSRSDLFVDSAFAALFAYRDYNDLLFTEAKVLGNWTGFSTKLYSSLFTTGTHHSLMNALINTVTIALIAATASTLLGVSLLSASST